ncbi:MAG: RNA methyltransferase [Gammaproteobacteria bacterium]|nr:RNA methyltransferase [Sideroxydans sp.]MBU3904019.1 RNA methyltransferase [Gammaproteobacteria bacterium]MBU4046732.1 RNA methyltransferase [Gammaproteobacteria bacterium]MBU4151104.1 RNA methyltransferase [Gammaproteobacteria bacterium]
MSDLKRISSRDNAFFKSLLRLTGSSRERRDAGQTLLDGPHLLRAWLDSGRLPAHILLSPQALEDAEISRLRADCPDVPCTLLEESLFKQLSELKTPNGLLALIDIPQPDPARSNNFALLLEDVQDPGNLGSILRSAAAAGCDAVYLSQGCADAWSPRVLRAAMGGHFVLAINESSDLLDIASRFDGMLFASSLEAKTSLYECNLNGKIAFAVGNEGAGLSAELQDKAQQRFIIPMPGKVESLNAAAATAVCLFEAARQRR